jgi:alpha-N-arabinofuranosidase
MDQYDPDKRVDLLVDEWGGWYDVEPGTNPGFLYQQNTMRDAMLAAATLNIFNNHADRVKMANIAQAINVLQAVILTDGEKMLLTPTYHVFRMYVPHHDATLVPLSFESPDYVHNGETLPAISASASRDSTGNLHFSLVNIDDERSHEIELDVSGMDLSSVGGEILTAEDVRQHNTFGAPDRVHPSRYSGTTLQGGKLRLSLPPVSLVVLTASQ